MHASEMPVGPSARDWANAPLKVTKVEANNPEEAIYEFRKELVINGVQHQQFAWVNQQQLRIVAIDHGL
ncbi:MAG: hypothetical protein U0744_00240 [Gemmataceae bacterium]